MATELIGIGTGAAVAEFSAEAGTAVWLKFDDSAQSPGYVGVSIQAKNSDGSFTTLGGLSGREAGVVLGADGDYRVSRPTGSVAVGVERT